MIYLLRKKKKFFIVNNNLQYSLEQSLIYTTIEFVLELFHFR